MNITWTVRGMRQRIDSSGTVYYLDLTAVFGSHSAVVSVPSSSAFTGFTVGQTISSSFTLPNGASATISQ